MAYDRPPWLVLIADGFTRSGQDQRVMQAVRYGVRWIILRDHGVRPDIMELSARLLIGRIRALEPSTKIVLNGPEDIARRLDIGWHRRSHELPVTVNSQRHQAPEGRSTHTLAEIAEAREEGVDYALFGHVFETNSHRGESPRGLDALTKACIEAGEAMSVIAIGGITPDRARQCVEAGAAGVAVLSGIMQAPNVFQAVDAYTRALTRPFDAE